MPRGAQLKSRSMQLTAFNQSCHGIFSYRLKSNWIIIISKRALGPFIAFKDNSLYYLFFVTLYILYLYEYLQWNITCSRDYYFDILANHLNNCYNCEFLHMRLTGCDLYDSLCIALIHLSEWWFLGFHVHYPSNATNHCVKLRWWRPPNAFLL